MNATIQKLNAQIAKYKVDQRLMASELNSLKLQKNSIETNPIQNSELVSSIHGYKLNEVILQSKVSNLTEQLAEKTNRPRFLRLRKENTDLQAIIDTKNLEIETLITQLSAIQSSDIDITDNTPSISSLELNNLNQNLELYKGMLSETQQHMQELEKSNMTLQSELSSKNQELSAKPQNTKLPPRLALQNHIKRFRNQLAQKDKVIQELNNAVPKVHVHLDEKHVRELKNVSFRHKIFEIVNRINNKYEVNDTNNDNKKVNKKDSSSINIHLDGEKIVNLSDANLRSKLEALIKNSKKNNSSKIHVHLNGETIVDISDKNIKLKLEELMKQAKNKNSSKIHVHLNGGNIIDISDKNIKNMLQDLIYESKRNNKSKIHVHLNDEKIVSINDGDIKNKLEDLIRNADTTLYNTKNAVNNIDSYMYRSRMALGAQPAYDELEEGDEVDEEFDEEFVEGADEDEYEYDTMADADNDGIADADDYDDDNDGIDDNDDDDDDNDGIADADDDDDNNDGIADDDADNDGIAAADDDDDDNDGIADAYDDDDDNDGLTDSEEF